ncbi:MAG: CDP-alcohol phosphatidyltransferase family protein [Bacteroidetes bacterium]|nr:CDP-alcohol phosphatidyltransferase family protein [Bacteroidota bacterium]
MNIKKHIPNAITCGNLLCGCLAIVKAFEGNLVWAAYLVGIAAVLDFFDGLAARRLKVSSPIGKDLDSLADMVTFGVVPGVVMFQLMRNWSESEKGLSPLSQNEFLSYFAFIITIFSAIRLAKFNNDTRQSESFIGLPTPANAILILSIPIIINFKNGMWFTDVHENLRPFVHPYVLCLMSLILSFLLVSELPLFALKFKHFKWKGNEIRFIFLFLSAVMLVTLQFVGIPLIIVLYILMSVISNISKKKAVS